MSTRNLTSDALLVGPTTRHPTLADVHDLPSCAGGQVVPVGADLSVELRAVRPAGGDAAGEAEVLICDGPLPDPAPAGICAVISRIGTAEGVPGPGDRPRPRRLLERRHRRPRPDLFGAHRGPPCRRPRAVGASACR